MSERDERARAHTHTHERMHARTHARARAHTHLHARTPARAHTHTRARTHTRTHKRARAPHARTHTYTMPLNASVSASILLRNHMQAAHAPIPHWHPAACPRPIGRPQCREGLDAGLIFCVGFAAGRLGGGGALRRMRRARTVGSILPGGRVLADSDGAAAAPAGPWVDSSRDAAGRCRN